MDLISAVTSLEQTPELHHARLLVLLYAFVGDDTSRQLQGITKLAKLDFLLRYPLLLERALKAKSRSTAGIELQDFERRSVESKMVRYRFGPWDHRYHGFLNTLVAKRLVTLSLDGRTVGIGLTEQGRSIAATLSSSPAFADMVRRAASLHRHFDVQATHLMRFIYTTFPEMVSMKKNEAIGT